MCSSKVRLHQGSNVTTTIAKINGRPVLQPKSIQGPTLERRNSLKKNTPKSPSPQPEFASEPPLLPPANPCTSKYLLSPPISPKLKSPRQPALKRSNYLGGLNSSAEKVLRPRSTAKVTSVVKKSKKSDPAAGVAHSAELCSVKGSSSLTVQVPGSIAAARREQVATMQELRKMRIAHYGRTKHAKHEGKVVLADSPSTNIATREERKCNFITPNSDPIYVAYHDEEWGVPAHDDKKLFELLVLTGAQVGLDWTSVLRKRQAFREAFAEFEAEEVAKFTEKKILSTGAEFGIDISLVWRVVHNSKRILEVKKEFGSYDKYLWGFVNYKPIRNQYKSCHKIPVKTSKSEAISKDMVKKGFRFVGPTVIHSFMQAAGLSNDHLITCPRQIHCNVLACQHPPVAPYL